MLLMKDMPVGSVVFTHRDTQGEERTFSVEHLWEQAQRLLSAGQIEVVYALLSRDFAKWAVANRGIEKHRLDRLKPEHLTPVLFLNWYDDTKLLVDGHHRYVKAVKLFRRTIKCVCLEPSQWEPFVIADAPKFGSNDAIVNMPSNIR